MNKLDYSLSLREKGLSSDEIKKKMKEKGFEESQIEYYLKKSDDIFLNNPISNTKSKRNRKAKNRLKTVTLFLSLFLLYFVFFGYARIGLLGLFILWSLLGYSAYKR